MKCCKSLLIHSLMLLVIISLCLTTNAQAKKKSKSTKPSKVYVTTVEGSKDEEIVKPPIFSDTDEVIEASYGTVYSDFREFLDTTLNPEIPYLNKAPKGIYTVKIEFTVKEDGTINEFKALTNHGFGMEDEVIRVLRLSKKWTPATKNGKPVKSTKIQPVTFMVE